MLSGLVSFLCDYSVFVFPFLFVVSCLFLCLVFFSRTEYFGLRVFYAFIVIFIVFIMLFLFPDPDLDSFSGCCNCYCNCCGGS